eukprot:10609460-Lingulodinium_polyedra.AAC.1
MPWAAGGGPAKQSCPRGKSACSSAPTADGRPSRFCRQCYIQRLVPANTASPSELSSRSCS